MYNRRMIRTVLFATMILWTVLGGRTARADKAPRFVALHINGVRTQGNALTDGHLNTPSLKLDGLPLLEGGNSVRWIKDRSLVPGPPPKAFVEMTTGDCLPGAIVGYREGTELPYDPLPAHFLVRPDVALTPPSPGSDAPIRVLSRFVRRVVWQRRDRGQYQPSTIFLKDGRSFGYRAVRLADGLVNLLTADGQRRVFFNEIAELHLPAVDGWASYLDELSVVAPAVTSRLLQLESVQGLIVTASWERFATRGDGGPQNSQQWVHGLHPAWSLDLLWVPSGTVWMRRFFAPHEIPLSRRGMAKVVESSPLGILSRQPQVNRNVQHGQLRSGNADFGWGFGVHASTELHFEIPAGATVFRSMVGLDRIAGRGGCVRARVLADGAMRSTLFESPFLVGSEQAVATGDLRLVDLATGRQRLVLQIDAAHDGRPAGADPLDIRDIADWLDPLMEIDPLVLRRQLNERVSGQLAAWTGWTLAASASDTTDAPTPAAPAAPGVPVPLGEMEWTNQWDDAAALPGAFLLGSTVKNQSLGFERDLAIGDDDYWLVVSAFHLAPPAQPVRLELWLGGELVSEYTLPLRNRSVPDPRPWIVPLRAFRGRTVHARIVQTPAVTPVMWRSVRLTSQLPMLYQLFDEGTESASSIAASVGDPPVLTDEDRYSGQRVLRVAAGASSQILLPEPVAIRERPEWGEYRYLTFAVRRSGPGRFSLELNTADGREIAIRYDGGKGDPALGQAKRIYQENLPEQWVEFPRDLFADFGPFDITAVTLSSLDDRPTLFDKLFLARAQGDFELVQALQPVMNYPQLGQVAVVPGLMQRMLPATVLIDYPDGRHSTGVIIAADGDILTAGHAVGVPDQVVSVQLGDGRVVTGKTRGIDRGRNLGLVRITDPGSWPIVDMAPVPDVPRNLAYLGFGYAKGSARPGSPSGYLAELRRAVRESVCVEIDWQDPTSGSPLVDQNGRVIGLFSHRSPFEGSLFSRLLEPNAVLPRLRAGEVFGNWPVGIEPRWGATTRDGPTGCLITAVESDSAAALAGLAAGDLMNSWQGRPLQRSADLAQFLARSAPYASIAVEFTRQGKKQQRSVTLLPARP